MPRRNNRPEMTFEPLDLTPAEAMSSRPISQRPRTRDEIRRDQECREQRDRELQDRQRSARVNSGIDWAVCLVPGCGRELTRFRGYIQKENRHHSVALPLCFDHLAVAHSQVANKQTDPLLIEAATDLIERKQARAADAHEASKKKRLASTNGSIYYVRLNGLIKAGWTRDLHDRLRAYGPDVEVLAHYPATRADETNLHRQLRPFLAKGREWYQDCQALADFVAKAVEQYGPPTVTPRWTEPKDIIRLRKRSA